MSKPVPQYSRSDVNRAGEILIADHIPPGELEWAFGVLTNWRSCHGYPINTFQATLRDKINRLEIGDAIVAQRLKRQTSIISKLRIFNSMQLSRMQDIGGVRAVVKNFKQVKLLENDYRTSKRLSHSLIDAKDYISSPKSSGYRSVHLIYKYKNKSNPAYDGLRIELQIRNQLQHAWATAVETMGTFLDQALKSSQGDEEWLGFFALVSSAFAHLERCPPVPGYENLSPKETFVRTRDEAERLNIRERLDAFSYAMKTIGSEIRGVYNLLILDYSVKTVTIRSFGREKLDEANEAYTEAEKLVLNGEPLQVVLVSTGSVKNLRKAFPNYFLDTTEFIKALARIEKAI